MPTSYSGARPIDLDLKFGEIVSLRDAGCTPTRQRSDLSVTAGSTTVVAAEDVFRPTDVGCFMVVDYAGAVEPLYTTFASITDYTHGTLADPARTSTSSAGNCEIYRFPAGSETGFHQTETATVTAGSTAITIGGSSWSLHAARNLGNGVTITGAGRASLDATITEYVSPTTVVLSVAAGVTGSGFTYTWGRSIHTGLQGLLDGNVGRVLIPFAGPPTRTKTTGGALSVADSGRYWAMRRGVTIDCADTVLIGQHPSPILLAIPQANTDVGGDIEDGSYLIVNADRVTLAGLRFCSTGMHRHHAYGNRIVMRFNGASNGHLEDCVVEDCRVRDAFQVCMDGSSSTVHGAVLPFSSAGTVAIYAAYADNLSIRDVQVDDCGFDALSFIHCARGSITNTRLNEFQGCGVRFGYGNSDWRIDGIRTTVTKPGRGFWGGHIDFMSNLSGGDSVPVENGHTVSNWHAEGNCNYGALCRITGRNIRIQGVTAERLKRLAGIDTATLFAISPRNPTNSTPTDMSQRGVHDIAIDDVSIDLESGQSNWIGFRCDNFSDPAATLTGALPPMSNIRLSNFHAMPRPSRGVLNALGWMSGSNAGLSGFVVVGCRATTYGVTGTDVSTPTYSVTLYSAILEGAFVATAYDQSGAYSIGQFSRNYLEDYGNGSSNSRVGINIGNRSEVDFGDGNEAKYYGTCLYQIPPNLGGSGNTGAGQNSRNIPLNRMTPATGGTDLDYYWSQHLTDPNPFRIGAGPEPGVKALISGTPHLYRGLLALQGDGDSEPDGWPACVGLALMPGTGSGSNARAWMLQTNFDVDGPLAIMRSSTATGYPQYIQALFDASGKLRLYSTQTGADDSAIDLFPRKGSSLGGTPASDAASLRVTVNFSANGEAEFLFGDEVGDSFLSRFSMEPVSGGVRIFSRQGSLHIGGNGTFSEFLKWPGSDGSANQVLKTDGSGTLGWATPAVGDTLPVSDTTAIVAGSSDATKRLRFEVDGLTSGTTRVLTPLDDSYTIGGYDASHGGTGYGAYSQGAILAGKNSDSGLGVVGPSYDGQILQSDSSVDEGWKAVDNGRTASASASSDLTLSGTITDVSGASVSLDRDGVWEVTGSFYFGNCIDAGPHVGYLNVNGSNVTEIAVWSVAGDGLITRSWLVTVTSASWTAKLRGKTFGTGNIKATHTTIHAKLVAPA